MRASLRVNLWKANRNVVGMVSSTLLESENSARYSEQEIYAYAS